MKQDYPPLLAPGFHAFTFEQLAAVFIEPFARPERRRYLLGRLEAYLREVQALGIGYELWIDGSFATEKEEPGDIDLLFVVDAEGVNALGEQGRRAFEALLVDNPTIKRRYRCDVYVCAARDVETRSYWRGWFAFTRSEQPKGIARMRHSPT